MACVSDLNIAHKHSLLFKIIWSGSYKTLHLHRTKLLLVFAQSFILWGIGTSLCFLPFSQKQASFCGIFVFLINKTPLARHLLLKERICSWRSKCFDPMRIETKMKLPLNVCIHHNIWVFQNRELISELIIN